MSKTHEEIASEIVQALIQVMDAAIAPCSNSRGDFMHTFLSEKATAEAYTTILNAVRVELRRSTFGCFFFCMQDEIRGLFQPFSFYTFRI
ncbi:hypothetical protein CM49_01900 [Paenibacillus sp. P1XP2]|nr:hypothetical protein CM49_01900 [Paenibacillus sp. P1XP2]